MAPSSRSLKVVVFVLLAGLPALPLVLSVWAGPFTPNGTQPPLAHDMLLPSDCESCHGNFDNQANIEPYPTWAGSMMANAARDPIFWAALDVANNDVPGVGEFCLRCHTPAAWLAGRSEPPGGSTDGCGLLGNLDEADNDFEGVTCHFCHRMMVNPTPPMGQQTFYKGNAQFWVDDGDCSGPGSGPCRRGPYDYSVSGDPPPHEWAFSTYHTGSDICANCHNVTSPAESLIDENGTDTGIPYPIERTHREWEQSSYSLPGPGFQTCQGCHMPDATETDAFACIFQSNNRSGNMPVHRFVGGNTWVPGVLRDEYPNLGRTASYNATVAWTQDLLQNDSALVAVTGPGAPVMPGENLAVTVRVTNLTGHKLPTGYPEGRRMWLQVTARDAVGNAFWQSGAYDAATGVLTQDPQIKIYQTERGIWNRNGTNECDFTDGASNPIFHFVLNNCIALDNRIPPAGFSGGSDLETRPVGYTYPETAPGSGILVNYDDTTYQIPVPGGLVAPITIEARLLYQTVSKEYVEFLRDEAVTNNFPDDCISRTTGTPTMSRGELLHDIWTRRGRAAPTPMVLGSTVVQLDNDLFADGFESGNTSAWTVVFP
ncbi:MAG TPA: hypothetical protein VF017_19495 [Thermoanaerobaculia bacterium]|nr:hypothetical protein [Thermoanaerobaculia bacterium]